MRKSSARSDQRRPPRATRAAAQVHALEARRVDEDLEHRLRLGQPGHLRRVELEREEAACACRRRRAARSSSASSPGSAPGTGAARGPRTGSRPPRAPPRSRAPARPPRERAGAALGIEAQLEQLDQHRGDRRVRRERRLDERLRQREADLPHVLRVGAQHDDLVARAVRAATTRRLKSSFSTSPRKTRANASSNTSCSASTSTSVSAIGALQAEVVHPDRRRASLGGDRGTDARRAPCRPMCSSIGRLSDSVTGAPSAEQLEAQRAGRRPRAVGTATSRAARRRSSRAIICDVGDRGARGEVLAVAAGNASP